jgi:hypothetical protein
MRVHCQLLGRQAVPPRTQRRCGGRMVVVKNNQCWCSDGLEFLDASFWDSSLCGRIESQGCVGQRVVFARLAYSMVLSR